MFWDSKAAKRAVATGFACAIALGMAAGAAAQSVVVRATGPSAAQYPQGRKLPAGATLTLKAKDSVTVLDKSGTRVIAGPGNFTLDGAVNRDQSATTRLAGFIANRSATRTRTGAVRGGGPAPSGAMPNLWYVDVSRGGTWCVAGTGSSLWRPDASTPASGKLTSATGAASDITWTAGDSTEGWPGGMLPEDGKSYQISVSNGLSTTVSTVTTRVLAQVPSEIDETAAMLIENGCTAQLDLLLAKLDPEPAADSGAS